MKPATNVRNTAGAARKTTYNHWGGLRDMRRVVVFAFFTGIASALTAAGQTQPIKEVYSMAASLRGVRIPEFRHGYVVQWEPSGSHQPQQGFSAFAPDGKLAFTKHTVEVPGGMTPIVREVDFDDGGN